MPLHSTNDFQPFLGNLWAPPLLFRRRPSQSNCPPDTVSHPDKGCGLECQYSQGSIPPMPPPKLALRLPRLLPILYKLYQNSISGYSKAPWGLSVLSRVTCIFTGTIISPSLSLRQCPDRYAFRAGRNLPDKEFRYLRTVIVTAAVYWGFNSKLRFAANLSSYPSSTGQASAPILRLAALQRPVFLLNSRLGLFTAALQGFNTLNEHPFSRSYGVILPSSLTRVLSHTLGFSPRLPVSVCGTGTHFLARGFSWQCGIRNFGTIIPSPSQLSLHADGIFLTCSLTAWTR